jgi:hypothetical protein
LIPDAGFGGPVDIAFLGRTAYGALVKVGRNRTLTASRGSTLEPFRTG